MLFSPPSPWYRRALKALWFALLLYLTATVVRRIVAHEGRGRKAVR